MKKLMKYNLLWKFVTVVVVIDKLLSCAILLENCKMKDSSQEDEHQCIH